jgi:DNA-binding NarL/FixJ family response regulator
MLDVTQLTAENPSDTAGRVAQVLVLDPHALTRIGLTVVLNRQPWVGRCLVASELQEAVALAQRHRPDVAIVDVSKVGPFIASYLEPLHAACPRMPVVLEGNYVRSSQAQLTAPSAARLTPEMQPDEIAKVVSRVVAREPVACVPAARGEDRLSEREREVLDLMCTGATNREIAAAMYVGAETVKKHATAVYRKLGVRNRTEAVQRAAAQVAVAPISRGGAGLNSPYVG